VENVETLQKSGWLVLRGGSRYYLTGLPKSDQRVRVARKMDGVIVTGVKVMER
jgi:hypothetical protein